MQRGMLVRLEMNENLLFRARTQTEISHPGSHTHMHTSTGILVAGTVCDMLHSLAIGTQPDKPDKVSREQSHIPHDLRS